MDLFGLYHKGWEPVVERTESFMKKAAKGAFRHSVTLIGLAALCLLYLLEVEYSQITLWNGIAFIIIALTWIPLAVSLILRIVKYRRTRKELQQQKTEDNE